MERNGRNKRERKENDKKREIIELENKEINRKSRKEEIKIQERKKERNR